MNSTSKLRTALLALLTISFITVFSTGCGNSREDFVATGNSNVVTNGNLLFRFQQATAQTIDTVPAGTTTIRIDLFSSDVQNSSTFVVGETFPFAETIVFENVPPNVVSALVTTFNSDGLPTGFLVGSVVVVPGVNNEVDLGDPQAIPLDSIAVTPDPAVLVVGFAPNTTDTEQLTITGQFSAGFQNTVNTQTTGFGMPINADSTEFTLGNSDLANISADGILSVQFDGSDPTGNTTITSTYEFLGAERTDTSDLLVFFYSAAAGGTPEVPVGGTYTGENPFGTFRIFFSGANGLDGADGDIAFSLANTVTGVTIDAATGVITADNTAVPTTTFDVVVTYVDNGPGRSGLTFTDTVEFTVVTGNA